jgi:glycosyltransferase involved in cell wall biosynthesis
MRVALVITKGEPGGAQTHVAELCGALRGACDFLALVGGPSDSALERALARMAIRVEPIPALSNKLSAGSVLASVRQVARAARDWDADVVHVHSAVASAVGRMAARLAGIPVVYTAHGFAFKPAVAPLRRLAAYAGERVLAPLSTHLICVSAAELDLAMSLGMPRHKVSVISNGIADTALRARPGEEPARVVMVARMAAPKRHDLLLRAIRILASRGRSPAETLLAGAGPLMEKWRAAAAGVPGVRFCGDVADVPAMLARCQVFVLVSDHEGQPISVMEAMRAGLPVVASDLPGIRSQVTHGVEGLLTSCDPVAIADALESLIGDPALRARMGAAARLRYENDFSAAAMAERVSQVYAQAAAVHRRTASARPG